jgi:hypothetical protein
MLTDREFSCFPYARFLLIFFFSFKTQENCVAFSLRGENFYITENAGLAGSLLVILKLNNGSESSTESALRQLSLLCQLALAASWISFNLFLH